MAPATVASDPELASVIYAHDAFAGVHGAFGTSVRRLVRRVAYGGRKGLSALRRLRKTMPREIADGLGVQVAALARKRRR